MPPNRLQSRKPDRSLGFILRLSIILFLGLLFIRLFELLLDKLKLRRAPRPAPSSVLPAQPPAPPTVTSPLPELEIPPVFFEPPLPLIDLALPPVDTLTETAAPPAPEIPPETVTSLPFGEEAVAFEVVMPVVVAPAIPDIYSTLPPEIFLEDDEPQLTADGRLIKYQFNWQNPQLLQRIYPFRPQKLLDFLLYYTEIDLVNEFKTKGVADPVIQARIERSKQSIQANRLVVQQKLAAAIQDKQAKDKWFTSISGATQKTLRFKQVYYIDQQIRRAQEQLDDVLDQQEGFLKRVDWWPDDPQKPEAQRKHAAEQRNRWKLEAGNLEPKIIELKGKLKELTEFRDLFEQEAQLPGDEIAVQDVLRWELAQKKLPWKDLEKEWEADPLALQKKLLRQIVAWINREPDRFPEWLVYMVIHFSGMRYTSAHSSWADPRNLLETLKREDIEDQVKKLDSARLVQACQAAILRLRQRLAVKPLEVQALENQIESLDPPDRSALRNVWVSEAIDEVKALKDDNECLQALSDFRQELQTAARLDPSRQPMPDWVWAEICKFTPLRLQTQDPNWEASSPERWKWQYNRWREVLATWEQKDITAWRAKHRQSLDLVVIRAVCNEIAEHVQHLRGQAPWAGLTSKPKWYMSEQKKDPGRAYLRQAPKESDLKTGASIFWLEWVSTQPNAWQVARPLDGFVISPSDIRPDQPKPRKEISRKQLERLKEEQDDWDYEMRDNAYARRRRLPDRNELKKQGKTDKEIQQILAERKVKGEFENQYLRWRHEATIVGVFDMIAGRFVMTFETGQIGLRLRSVRELVHNPQIFVGYVPEKPFPDKPVDGGKSLDERLVSMLRWDRILPGEILPPRSRPRRISELEAPPPTDLLPPTQPPEKIPQQPVLVIRDDVRGYRYKLRDKEDRPKMEPITPLVRVPLGVSLTVSKVQKESKHDSGNGIVHAINGDFLYVVSCPEVPFAEGTYIHLQKVADASAGRWVTLGPEVQKALCNVFKGVDGKGKPIIQPLEDVSRRIIIRPETKLRISTVHSESDKDPGGGIIMGTGMAPFYVIIECPDMPEAEGLYIEMEAVVDTTPPE